MLAESSMNIGASARRPSADDSRVQSCSCREPRRILCESTRASDDKNLCTTSLRDISRLKNTTGCCCRVAELNAKSLNKLDLPIEGRAAITIRFEGWKPAVI